MEPCDRVAGNWFRDFRLNLPAMLPESNYWRNRHDPIG